MGKKRKKLLKGRGGGTSSLQYKELCITIKRPPHESYNDKPITVNRVNLRKNFVNTKTGK
jgi:hypothetical protein